MYTRYAKLVTGFIIASAVQAAVFWGAVAANIAVPIFKLSPATHVIMHIIVGQVAGFFLLYLMNTVESMRRVKLWVVGSLYGAGLWAVLIPIMGVLGAHELPWTRGFGTVLATVLAFMAYGTVAAYTIKITEPVKAS